VIKFVKLISYAKCSAVVKTVREFEFKVDIASAAYDMQITAKATVNAP